MPKMLGLYRHCGIEVLVDADNGGNLIVQPSAVEKWLLMRHRTSANNHSLTAYRDCACVCGWLWLCVCVVGWVGIYRGKEKDDRGAGVYAADCAH
jgi:hypothetical protein